MSILPVSTTHIWWKKLKFRLLIFYLLVSVALLAISISGQIRLLNEVGHTFGGFIWGIDADRQTVFVFTATSSLPSDSVTSCKPISSNLPSPLSTIISVNGQNPSTLPRIYQQATPGQFIRYESEFNGQRSCFQYPAARFDLQVWLQYYGLALLAGLSWLLVGGILLALARTWSRAVEGLTLLPMAMLFFLSSYWGNIQTAYPADTPLQLLWFSSLALLGAAFLHLSLTYRLETEGTARGPRWTLDVLPYLPPPGLAAFILSLFLIQGSVSTRLEAGLNLGYAVFGGIIGLVIGITSLVRRSATRKPAHTLLWLWIGALSLGLCLWPVPLALTGTPLLPLPLFFLLSAICPLVLLYIARSQYRIGQLHERIARAEETIHQQQRATEDLRRANAELQHATSLLLHADAHLRSVLSERIHDQPKQQALRIRSLLGHWQHKLKVESEHNPSLQSFAQPIIEALGKVRKISEELEGDLRGLQLLVEDTYQRRNLGLKLHLEKLVREDLPTLYPEAPLKIQADLWALDTLSQDLEQTLDGEKFAEAISYTITQALLNVYNHAGATFAAVRTLRNDGNLEVLIMDDGRGFDITSIPSEKTSMFKAELKAREAGGTLLIRSTPRPQVQHGTTIILKLPFPADEQLSAFGQESGYEDEQERSIGRNPA